MTSSILFHIFIFFILLQFFVIQTSKDSKLAAMKRKTLLLLIISVPLLATAQFEQKISLNLSGGAFSNIGPKTWMPEWGSSAEDEEPLQIANYKPGVFITLGLQYNLNRHLSFQADVGMMYSGNWFYDIYDGVNYTEYRIWDPADEDILLEQGHNEFTLRNVGVGLTPKYYLMPGKRMNPFLFGSLSFNFTSTTFDDNEWKAYRDLDMLAPDDSGPDRAFIENNTGMGFYPGIGLEFNVSDKFGFHLTAGYYFILLNETEFLTPEQNENLNAITLQAGVRFSFLKSKDI